MAARGKPSMVNPIPANGLRTAPCASSREEAGLAPDEFYKLSDAHVFYIAAHDTLWHSIQFCAVVKRNAVVVMDHEHDQFRWLPIESAEEHFMWPGDRRSIQEIREQIIGNGIAKPYMLAR